MSKTNHNRRFKAVKDSDRYRGGPGGSTGQRSTLGDVSVGAAISHDCVNGHRGHAADKRGAKKYVRTRIRFHENAQTQKLALEALATELSVDTNNYEGREE